MIIYNKINVIQLNAESIKLHTIIQMLGELQ